jgi:hypothetical protein
VLGLALHPASERQLVLLTTDGRLFLLSLLEREKLVMTAVLGGSAPTATVIRWGATFAT